jgi:hypothetical protein
MALRYDRPTYGSLNSTVSGVSGGNKNGMITPRNSYAIAYASVLPNFPIEKGFLIGHPRLLKAATVLHPFYIKIQPVRGEFIATCDIADVYESGETPIQAVLNCLYALVDEVMWFQDNKESISEPMLRDFKKLQYYVGLV